MKAIIVAAVFFALVEPCAAKGAKPDSEMTARERAAAFAVRHEIQSAHLEKKDTCVGFGHESRLAPNKCSPS